MLPVCFLFKHCGLVNGLCPELRLFTGVAFVHFVKHDPYFARLSSINPIYLIRRTADPVHGCKENVWPSNKASIIVYRCIH